MAIVMILIFFDNNLNNTRFFNGIVRNCQESNGSDTERGRGGLNNNTIMHYSICLIDNSKNVLYILV